MTTQPNPWWIPPFLGRVPAGISPSQLRLLGAVSLAMLFEEYDTAMLTAALKHIAEGLAIGETELPKYMGIVRLGALPAFLFIPLADRIGRRRIFMMSVVANGVLTFATAFVQTPLQFVALQALTRTFIVAGTAMALVIVTEEFPAQHRGWGIGMLGALGVIGHGVGNVLFALVERLPFGWRTLYAFGLVPVLLLPWFRARVHETERFERHRESAEAAGTPGAVLRSLGSLFRATPARALGMATVAFLPAVGLVSAFQFTSYFAQTVHGWKPWQYSTLVVLGGAIGIVGNIAAGHLGDRIGRRRVGFVLLALFPVFVTCFYRGPSWSLSVVWILFVFCSQGGRVIHRALATELFPTAHRAAASGLYAVLEMVGSAVGLFVLWLGSTAPGDLARMIPWLSVAAAIGGAVILLFPETRRRELEDISA